MFKLIIVLGAGTLLYLYLRAPKGPLASLDPLSEEWLAEHAYQAGQEGDPLQ